MCYVFHQKNKNVAYLRKVHVNEKRALILKYRWLAAGGQGDRFVKQNVKYLYSRGYCVPSSPTKGISSTTMIYALF